MFFAGRDLTVGNTVSATAVVVWIHGLGDTPDGWGQQMAKLAPALPHVRFELPLAPTQPVACNGGMAMTSWMDLEAIPIDLRTPDTGRHQAESLSRLHALIDGLGRRTVGWLWLRPPLPASGPSISPSRSRPPLSSRRISPWRSRPPLSSRRSGGRSAGTEAVLSGAPGWG